MNIETAEVSRPGDRETNQDRACVVVSDDDILLAVADGMGGHADGEVAATTAINTLIRKFKEARPRRGEDEAYLRDMVREAHREVVALGRGRAFEHQPRTTITLCTIAEGQARWAHVGDSRVYVYRDGRLLARTRDHSAVEEMFRKGLISEADMQTHPLRNFVEHCLGGEVETPNMDISEAHELRPGDIVLLSSDGFWAPLDTEALGEVLDETEDLQAALEEIAAEAERATRPYSDNVTAVAFRWLEDN